MSKKYVISIYEKGYAMYEEDDFRLKEQSIILIGKFKRDKLAKGLFNGYEKGFFICNNGEKYLIFSDHNALKMNGDKVVEIVE